MLCLLLRCSGAGCRNVLGRRLLLVRDDEAVSQGNAATGVGRKQRVVRDEDERGSFFAVEVQKEVENVAAVGGVKISGGLVGKNDGAVAG